MNQSSTTDPMVNPHTLLSFGPEMKGGHEIINILQVEGPGNADCMLALLADTVDSGLLVPTYFQEDGAHLWFDSDHEVMEVSPYRKYDLMPTDSPPYAPQPYTLWEQEQEQEQENAKLKAENQRYRKALEFYADGVLTYGITQANEPRSAVHADAGKIAREALKGGGYE